MTTKKKQKDWLTKKSSRLSKIDICILICNGLDAPTILEKGIIVTPSMITALRVSVFKLAPEYVCALRAATHSQTRERGTRDILEAIFIDIHTTLTEKLVNLIRIGTNSLPNMRFMHQGSLETIRKEAMSIRKFRLFDEELITLREACEAFQALPQIHKKKEATK